MTSRITYDPALSELKNNNLQEAAVEYIGILDALRETMLADLDNPDIPALDQPILKFGENLILAQAAGHVFLFHLRQMSAATENAR